MTTEQILAALERIGARIDRAFAEDADKYEADKHAALEEVDRLVADLGSQIRGD